MSPAEPVVSPVRKEMCPEAPAGFAVRIWTDCPADDSAVIPEEALLSKLIAPALSTTNPFVVASIPVSERTSSGLPALASAWRKTMTP